MIGAAVGQQAIFFLPMWRDLETVMPMPRPAAKDDHCLYRPTGNILYGMGMLELGIIFVFEQPLIDAAIVKMIKRTLQGWL